MRPSKSVIIIKSLIVGHLRIEIIFKDMPNKEEQENKTKLTFQILRSVALAGTIAAVLLLPGLAVAVAPFIQGRDKNKKEKIATTRISATLWRLKKRGFLKDNNGKLSLTPKGKLLLLRYQTKECVINKPKKWDGKWRVIAFDVWESRRSVRNFLRKMLQNLGFVKLQASLWVYPYDCEEIIELLRTDLKIFSAICYMVVEKIDRDEWLRKYFNLSR
jgi:hypothetical protein